MGRGEVEVMSEEKKNTNEAAWAKGEREKGDASKCWWPLREGAGQKQQTEREAAGTEVTEISPPEETAAGSWRWGRSAAHRSVAGRAHGTEHTD